MTKPTNDANFTRDVLKSAIPSLVFFHADWAGPCHLMRPIFDELATKRGNQIAFFDFNLDDNPETPARFGLRGIPAVVLFENGVPTQAKVGAFPAEHLEAMIEHLT